MCFNLKAQNNSFLPSGAKEQKQQAITFTENKGQVSDQNYKPRPDVLFSGNANGMVFHLRNNGISYQLNRINSWKEEEDPKTNQKIKMPDQTTIYRLDINWLGINKNFKTQTYEALYGYNNYYLEVCPNGVINVKTFKDVFYKSIYNKIDLHYYENKNNLKYDYIVEPGGNYKQIQLEIKGTDKIELQKDGSIIFDTPFGKIQEGMPVVFQNNKKLKAKWKINKNVLSFDIENYDPKCTLLIDPLIRIWGTFYGGTSNDDIQKCKGDAFGNIYSGGITQSLTNTVIATSGAHQYIFGGGSRDAFITKFDSNGNRVWSTYYGGTGDEFGLSCTVDVSNDVYLSGKTNSSTSSVIATSGSYQNINGGGDDAFLVKFNSNGTRIWGTYYGGSGTDDGEGCSTDSFGYVYLTGTTTSTVANVISTMGSYQSNSNGGSEAYLVKFDSTGVRQWGTFYGGSGSETGYCCSNDTQGNVYLCGTTNVNSGAISTSGCHQSNYGGGSRDAFIVKFNSSGVRQWGTYYGGNDDDLGIYCCTDNFNNVYLTGNSMSSVSNVISTLGSHQSVHGGGSSRDAYLVKFNSAGVRQWATYYGNTGTDYGMCCSTDIFGNIYLSGHTLSTSSIATIGSYQSIYGGIFFDAFLVKFDNLGVRLWGTYYGGTDSETGYSCYADNIGNVYLAGATTEAVNPNIIASVGSHQTVNGGGSSGDGYLVRFNDCSVVTTSLINQTNVLCNGNASGSATISASGGNGISYTWSPIGGNSFSANNLSAQIYTCTVSNNCNNIATQTVLITQPTTSISVSASTTNSLICIGNSATLSANGSGGTGIITFSWQPSGSGASIIVTPTINTTYTLIATDANNCITSTSITQSVSLCTLLRADTFKNSKITVYPNPTNQFLNIELEILDQNTKIEIYNSLGQIVLHDNLVNTRSAFDLQQLSNGVYFCKISENDSLIFNSKIIRQ